MKRNRLSITAAVLLSTLLFASCGTQSPAPQPGTSDAASSDIIPESTSSAATDEGSSDSTDTASAPSSLRILAIGNSFSTDCMQYLYNILKSGGVKEVVLGNLYYGGCSLAQHLDFVSNNKPVYKYYKNVSGNWELTENYRFSDAVKEEKWDYITFQQTSKTCGLEASYGKTLTSLVDLVEAAAPDSAKFLWNMTWAYQQDSTHSSFPNYQKSQEKMYDMIIDCVEKCIKPEKRFVGIIPCMTSIQNARTSFLGDTLTRDGFHLDYYIGRYIAGLTWFSAITGLSPDAVTYNPSPSMISDDMLAVAREAVSDAMKTPYAVTKSRITDGKHGDGTPTHDPTLSLSPADFYEQDKKTAAAAGTDLSGYKLLEWEYTENSYWFCTKGTSVTTPKAGASTYRQNVCTKVKYSTADIPAGALFFCDSGWQYRLEIFPAENQKYSGTRPGMMSSGMFVLSEKFLDGCGYIAWNVSSDPKSDISDIYAQAACHVRVYVPNK